MNTQYRGSTIEIGGASNFITKAIVTIEEGYNYGASLEYKRVGDFRLENMNASGEQQQRLTLEMAHPLDYSNNHYQPFTTVHSSAINYRTDFLDEDLFNAEWQFMDGCTTGVSGLRINQIGEQQNRHMILGKYNDLSDVRILTKFSRAAATTTSRAFSQVFRYTDENNYMFIRYDNNPAGVIIFGDITWDGATARETRIHTVTGISVRANSPFTMYTVVHNDRVIHLGSTDGYTYTKHFDVSNLYGSSWQPTVEKFTNTIGSVGFITLGKSNGNFYVPEFQVDSLSDQYTYDTSIRHISASSGIFGVSIRQEFSDMTDMLPSQGSCWAITSNSAVRYLTTPGVTFDTLFTSGNTFEDFVATCYTEGISSGLAGMAFGNTTEFYGYRITYDRVAGGLEHYISDSIRIFGDNVGTHLNTVPNVPFEMKMVKQGVRLSWYVNGLLAATTYGTTSGDILNSSGRIGVFCFGNTAIGITSAYSDFKISTLDYPVETFQVEGNNAPRAMLDRFIPKGHVVNSSQEGINIVEIGASRGTFNLNSAVRDPMLSERYNLDPQHVSIRGEKYSFNLETGISRTSIRVDDSYISNSNDSNITSTKNAFSLATDNMREENIEVYKANIVVNAIPTLEPFDKVTVVDTTLGESAVYLVEGLNKSYSADGAFTETLQLTRNGE